MFSLVIRFLLAGGVCSRAVRQAQNAVVVLLNRYGDPLGHPMGSLPRGPEVHGQGTSNSKLSDASTALHLPEQNIVREFLRHAGLLMVLSRWFCVPGT